mgnify:FL=1
MKHAIKVLPMIFVLFMLNNAHAQDAAEEKKYGFNELLCGYLEHDFELKKLTIEAQKSKLALENAKINEGFDVTLSTGTMTFYTGSGSGDFSVKPSAKISVPSAKNLSVNASADYRYDGSSETSDLKDGKIGVSFDIISPVQEQSRIEILKKEREVLEAKRKIYNSALSAEKNFYQEMKSLLSSINSVYTNLQDVYTDTLSFEKIKAQGYTSSSSTYRLAEMKVLSGRHTIETAVHKIRHDFVVFYKKCGIDLSMDNERDFLKFIPDDIPQLEGLKFTSFDKEKYKEIENAKWINKINSLARKADKNFSLGLNAGYTFENSATKTDTIDAGISTTWNGLGVNCGISFPTGTDEFTPAFTLGATVNLNSFRPRAINEETYKLPEKQELIDLDTANADYETSIIDFDQQLDNILWEKGSVAENFLLYQKNEEDLEKYYKMGIVTQSEYLSAMNNRLLYQVKIIINTIDMILYNNSVQSNFVDIDISLPESTAVQLKSGEKE